MTDGDGVVSDQDFFDNEAHDSLTFRDAKRFSSAVQAGKKCDERFGQTQKCGPIVALVDQGLQFRTESLFALAQYRHAFPQMLDRQ